MEDKYLIVKKYYDKQLWNETRVRNAVKKGWITEKEYKEIVGEDYAGDDRETK